MIYPKVQVAEISREKDQLIIKDPEVDLGGWNLQHAVNEASLNGLLASMRRESNHMFLLKWKGGKIPRGAKVLTHTISWTQNGEVKNDKGKTIGTYERLVENGGSDGSEQKMIVFVFPSAVEGITL